MTDGDVILSIVDDAMTVNVPTPAAHHAPAGVDWLTEAGRKDLALNILLAAHPGGPKGRVPCRVGSVPQPVWAAHLRFARQVLSNVQAEGGTIPAAAVAEFVSGS